MRFFSFKNAKIILGLAGLIFTSAQFAFSQTPYEGMQLYFEKRIFYYSNISNQRTETATFDPGSVVVVRLKLNPNKVEQVPLRVRDYRLLNSTVIRNSTSLDDKVRICGLTSSDRILTSSFSANQGRDFSEWNNIEFYDGDGYLCYSYLLEDNPQGKNVVTQLQSTLFELIGGQESALASVNNYLMIKGFALTNSQTPTYDDPRRLFPIDDVLSFANTVAKQQLSAQETRDLSSMPSYTYNRGYGPRSRGGELLYLPAYSTSADRRIFYDADPFYLMYNPAFYIFGNVFSGGSYLGSAIDFNSRSSSISRLAYPDDRMNKLNSDAALYNYDFDKNSVLFWDTCSRDKSQKMEENIMRMIGSTARPAVVCDATNSSFTQPVVYLNSATCNVSQGDPNNLWPNGRVWYLRASSSTVDISATQIYGKGTLIVDFADVSGVPKVSIHTDTSSFRSSNGALGLIVINGGDVEFAADSSGFDGMIFNPGKRYTLPTCRAPANPGGAITFVKDGDPIRVRGSLVANTINLNPRRKTSTGYSSRYSVYIYSDSKLLNSPLPAFENIMNIILE